MRGYYTNFRDANSQAVQPETANLTGGQKPARDVSPAGPFSHSNAADTHGAASAGGGVGSPPSLAPAHLMPADLKPASLKWAKRKQPEIEDDGFVTAYPPLNTRHGATNIGE